MVWLSLWCQQHENRTRPLHTRALFLGQCKCSSVEYNSTISNTGETACNVNYLFCQRPDITRYSSKSYAKEDVYLEPTTELGLSARWCPLASSANVWHVLDVHPSSPAEIAGFIPFTDYIIGSPEGVLGGESSLGELVEEVFFHHTALKIVSSSAFTTLGLQFRTWYSPDGYHRPWSGLGRRRSIGI